MLGFLGKGARWLVKDGRGIGLLMAGAGVAAGRPELTVKGAQLATAGVVKQVSKAAGREVHRVLSPAACLAVGVVGMALGVHSPLMVHAASGDVSGFAHLLELSIVASADAAMVSGAQAIGKSVKGAATDFVRDRSW